MNQYIIGLLTALGILGSSCAQAYIPYAVTSGSDKTRFEAVNFGTTSSTACSASPCAYVNQQDSWVTSVTRTSQGVYVLNIAAGVFSSVPFCTGTPAASNAPTTLWIRQQINTTTAVTMHTPSSVGVDTDDMVTVMCWGAR